MILLIEEELIMDLILKSFINQFPGLVVVVDNQGEIVLFNKKFCNVFGLSVEEVKGKSYDDIFSEKNKDVNQALCTNKPTAGCNYFLGANDEKIEFIYLNIPVVLDNGQQGVISLRVKNNLKQNLNIYECEYKNILNIMKKYFINLDTGVVSVLNRKKELLNINKAGLNKLDLEKRKIVGKPVQQIFSNSFSNIGIELKKIINQALEAKQVIKVQKPFDFSQQNKFLDIIVIPIIITGKTIGVLVLVINNKEKMRLNKFLERSDRIKKAGEMAYRITHEIRNPLQLVKTSAQLGKTMAEKENYDLNKIKNYYDKINYGIGEVMEVLDDILDFLKLEEANFKKMKVESFLREIKDLAAYYCVKNNINLIFKSDKNIEDLQVELDFNLMKQAVLNVVQNAVEKLKACKAERCIGVKCEKECQCKITVNSWVQQQHLMIMISNNGPVISQEIKESIFDIFTSTKGENGTGLGLSIVHHIVHHLHQGEVWFDSNPEVGTNFYFKLPLEQEQYSQLCKGSKDIDFYYKGNKQAR